MPETLRNMFTSLDLRSGGLASFALQSSTGKHPKALLCFAQNWRASVAEIPSCSSRHKTGQVFMCDLNTVHEFLESVVQMSIWRWNELLNAYLGMDPCLHESATLFLKKNLDYLYNEIKAVPVISLQICTRQFFNIQLFVQFLYSI